MGYDHIYKYIYMYIYIYIYVYIYICIYIYTYIYIYMCACVCMCVCVCVCVSTIAMYVCSEGVKCFQYNIPTGRGIATECTIPFLKMSASAPGVLYITAATPV